MINASIRPRSSRLTPFALAVVFAALTSLFLADFAEARRKGSFGGRSGASVQQRFGGAGARNNFSRNKQFNQRSSGNFGAGVNRAVH